MIKSYLIIAIRNLLKHKFYTLINVFGLAIGIACCLILVLYIKSELTYDKHNENFDRIYRINANINFGGKYMEIPFMPAPFASAAISDFPDIETAVRFRKDGTALVKTPDGENITQGNSVFVDSTVFDVFTIPIIKGNKKSILSRPQTVAISESISKVYFKDEDPIGKRLIFDNDEEYEVTAVFEDMPATSHFHYDFLLSMEGYEDARNQIWLSHNYYTYILLRENVEDPAWDDKFNTVMEKYVVPQIMHFTQKSFEEFKSSGSELQYWAISLGDIHLHSNMQFEMEANGNIQHVKMFSLIGFFVLLIASINFMNLSTARSSTRSKEVGIRKVLGSFRSQIIAQFLAEAFIITGVALIIGVILIELLIPFFNEFSNTSLEFVHFTDPVILVAIILIFVVVGLLSGSYPAFFLSSFAPVTVLRGRLLSSMKSGGLRKTLVVIQFVISIALVIGTMVIVKQLNFIQNYELGFNKDQVLIIQDAYALGDNLETFKNELLDYPDIKSVSITSFLPVDFSSRSDNAFWPEGKDFNTENSVSLQNWRVDEDYLKTMGMELIAGRDFSPDRPTDTAAVILNERAVELFKIKEDPIGAKIQTINMTPQGPDFDNPFVYEVIGVVKDFNFDNFKSNINALALFNLPSEGFLTVKVSSSNIMNTVDNVEQKWLSMVDDQPFAYSFLDDRFNEMYDREERVAKLVGLFAGLAIFVACLGLFALASFTAEQRTKEIGVRKVMGASVWDIVILLGREFNRLVIIAFVIASVLAYFSLEKWFLQEFAYRTQVSIWIILLAGVFSFLIAWITMSYQSVKAGSADPVKSLRYE